MEKGKKWQRYILASFDLKLSEFYQESDYGVKNHLIQSGLFDFCRTGLNRLGETGLNRQVSAGRNREKLGET